MALFAISDLHLSTAADTDKSMEVFGRKWAGYTERLEKNWRAVVSDGDTVVIPGDVSWSISLAGTESDFTFLHSLPGKKILGKGNHDFWWSTEAKMNAYLSSLGFDDIRFLHNNALFCDGRIVCGTRGWFSEDDEGAHGDFEKLVNREATRLKLSLDAAKKLSDEHPGAKTVAFFHFPPVWAITTYEIHFLGCGAAEIFCQKTSVFRHLCCRLAMQSRINTVESMGQNTYRGHSVL